MKITTTQRTIYSENFDPNISVTSSKEGVILSRVADRRIAFSLIEIPYLIEALNLFLNEKKSNTGE